VKGLLTEELEVYRLKKSNCFEGVGEWVGDWKWESGVGQREGKKRSGEEYAAPKNESREDRANRLKRRRQAKYMHYQKEEDIAGPSRRTRSQTSKASSETRSKTKE
ncbi:24371_t:CDS:2, partial [Dentiscutata erythropus]